MQKKHKNVHKIDKKAQAAMEFMLTYGWMLLVVVGVVSALAYFGVSSTKVIPEMCILDTGVACIDFKITSTESSIVILNGIKDFEIIEATIGDCTKQFSGLEAISGQKQTIVLDNCDNGNKGNKLKEVIQLTRRDSETGLERIHEGEVTGLIQ